MIINEIISKWVVNYKDFHLIITENKNVYDIKTKLLLIEYWNNGTISYRIPKTSKRIGVKTINKYCIKKKIILQNFLPF